MSDARFRFWRGWLIAAALFVALFALGMLLIPGIMQRYFDWLFFGGRSSIDVFGAQAHGYILFTNGVLGGVMLGWAVLILYLAIRPFARRDREAWLALAWSVAAWFISDSAISVAAGYWPNAASNGGFMLLFAIPLAATWRAVREQPRTM
jgi:uncharacterized membrane protein YhaH (DUF805 family)